MIVASTSENATRLPLRLDLARAHARAYLAGLPNRPTESQMDDTVQVLDELIANAWQHAAGPTAASLRVTPDGSVSVEVRDASTRIPRPREPSPDDEHWRGLRIVAALATWGAEACPPRGKRVWALVAPQR
jgi:hypothetical protein